MIGISRYLLNYCINDYQCIVYIQNCRFLIICFKILFPFGSNWLIVNLILTFKYVILFKKVDQKNLHNLIY